MIKGKNEKDEEYLEHKGVPCNRCNTFFTVRYYFKDEPNLLDESVVGKRLKKITSRCGCRTNIFYSGGPITTVLKDDFDPGKLRAAKPGSGGEREG